MKKKISISLSSHVLSRIDHMVGPRRSRSAVIELILRSYFRQKARPCNHARDLDLLNKHAQTLNAEALDVLEYQASERLVL